MSIEFIEIPHLKVADELLHALLLVLRLPSPELRALVIPDALLRVVHEARLLQLHLAHPRGHHQHLKIRILLIRQSGNVKADLDKRVTHADFYTNKYI